MSLDPSDEAWIEAHAVELRDAVLAVHASPALVEGLLRRAPDRRRLAVVCLCGSLSSLRDHASAFPNLEEADGPVAYLGDLTRLLRAIPLRWRMVLIDGPIDDVSARMLSDLADSIAADGTLSWRRADAAADAGLDLLVARRRARAGGRSEFWRSVIVRHDLPRPGATSRPVAWATLRSRLVAHYLAPRPAEDVGDILRPFRQAWLLEEARGGGAGRWPYGSAKRGQAPPSCLPDGRAWPRISILTLALGEPQDIESAILSVARQGYPDVDHIVVDGGVSGPATEVVERYRDRIAFVVRHVDGDLGGAIKDAMGAATGDLVMWLDAIDMLTDGALFAVALAFATSGADVVAGIAECLQDKTLVEAHLTSCADGPLSLGDLSGGAHDLPRSAVVFTRALWQAAGGRVEGATETAIRSTLWQRFAGLAATLHVIGRPLVRRRSGPLADPTISAIEELGTLPDDVGRPWRIVMLDDLGPIGGAGIAMARLASAFRRAGHHVEALTFLDDLRSAEPADGAAAVAFAERIGRHRPDVVLLGNLHGVGLDPRLLREVFARWPSLILLHDLWWLTGRCAYTGRCAKFAQGCDAACPTASEYPPLDPALIADAWAEKRVLLSGERSPILVGYSSWAVSMAQAAFPAAPKPRIEQIRLGVPLDIFRPSDRDLCRDRLGLPRDRFIVLFSARYLTDPRKGGDQIWSLIRDLRLPDMLFVAVGGGDLRQLGLPADRFRSLGLVESQAQMALVNAAADVVVLPSTEETFGQTSIEAMACGVPVIGHGLTGTADAVVDGVTGLITLAPTEVELEAALLTLYRRPSLRAAMGFCARLMAENEWALEASAHRFVGALRRLGLVDTPALPQSLSFVPSNETDAPTVGQVAALPELDGLTTAEYKTRIMRSVLETASLKRKLISLRQENARLKSGQPDER
jgi:glycosyltransferase involved in cell wall biosynthesis